MENNITADMFAERLSFLISGSKKPLKILAEEIGVSVGALSNYQNGRAVANIDALRKIAQYFNVSADWLVGLSAAPSPQTDIQAIHKKTGLWEDSIVRLSVEKDSGDMEISNLLSFLSVNPRISDLIAAIQGKNKFAAAPKSVTIDVEGTDYQTNMENLFKMIVSDLFFEIIEGYSAKPGEIMIGYKAGESNG